jgi:tRNA A-37 threonylcarbamoyl transferase component Bud32
MKASGEDDPLVGRCLGEFQIVHLIGRGGMGASVYKARQIPLDRFVAIKILPRGGQKEAKYADRFFREARAAAAVTHPNIVQVHAVGRDEEYLYIAMELVEGENLADVLRREGKLTPHRAAEVMKQVAAALQRAHAAGIVHRDIKPSNLLVCGDGLVKVADFGLAKRSGVDMSVTQPCEAVGTPLYMAPEATRGEHLDGRSDLYSLGATAYHLLAGRPPFRGSTHVELMLKHARRRPTPLGRLAPEVPPALCGIVHRLLGKRASERFQSAAELLDALERADLDAVAQPAGRGAGVGDGRLARALWGLAARSSDLLRLAWARCLPFRERLRRGPVLAALVAAALVCVVLLLLVFSPKLDPTHVRVQPPAKEREMERDHRPPEGAPTIAIPTTKTPGTKPGSSRTAPRVPPPRTPTTPVSVKPPLKTSVVVKPPAPPVPRVPPRKEAAPPERKPWSLKDLQALAAAGGWRREYAEALGVILAGHSTGGSVEGFVEFFVRFHDLNAIIHPQSAGRGVAFSIEEDSLAALVQQAAKSARCVVGLVDHALFFAPSAEEMDKAEAVTLQSRGEIPAELAARLDGAISLDVADSTLARAARAFTTEARVSVAVAPECAERVLTVRVDRVPARSALLWLARLTGTTAVYENGVISLVPLPAQESTKPKAP